MTLAEILAPYGVGDEEYLAELADALGSRPRPAAAALTAAQREFLDRHGGVDASGGEGIDPARSWLGTVTANLAEQLQSSLTVVEVGAMLGISDSRVRHRVHEGGLYAFKAAHQLRLPRWQFDDGSPLPGLRVVLAALDPGLHPLEVTGFMTTPQSDLEVLEEAVSPRDWLISGGDPSAVEALGAAIGAGW